MDRVVDDQAVKAIRDDAAGPQLVHRSMNYATEPQPTDFPKRLTSSRSTGGASASPTRRGARLVD
jgi:hypothetical protein